MSVSGDDEQRPGDGVARPFHVQLSLLKRLVEENRRRMAAAGPAWDEWFDRIVKLPIDAAACFPEHAAAVAEIEAAAAEIVAQRDALPALRDRAMVEKIGRLAEESAASSLPLGERIARDFSRLDAWRKGHLDGVGCDMFALIERRRPSAAPRRGESRPLFETLFAAWAKAAGIPLREAEEAATAQRAADLAVEAAPAAPGMAGP